MDSTEHEILIIGAGFSGIGVAVRLEEAGLRDYAIVEQGDDFGGTWYWNRYPGLAVDIPSFSYQYSFAQSPDWSRTYAPGDELLAYAKRCAGEHRLADRTRFGTKVTGAQFDEARHRWLVETDGGEEFSVRHIVDATGVLTVPKKPDIPGVESFAGQTIHTARWDPDADLAGKRVGVIGTGASAVQLIPEVAPDVEHLTVFQRTPIWCLPKFDSPSPPRSAGRCGGSPALSAPRGCSARPSSSSRSRSRPTSSSRFRLATALRGQGSRLHPRAGGDPELQEKLTPRYGLGCKRPSFHNTYLSTFNRENVDLETDPIAEITERGIRTADGTEHELDVLVLATGFKVFDPGNFPKYPISGREGRDLEEFWRVNRFQAYEGVSVPGFPNYFMVMGPYGYNGSSYFNLVETQGRHIVRCLSHAERSGATSVEVTAAANDRYFAEMMRRRKRQIFWQESCGLANSYYFDDHGDVPLRPVSTIETMWRARRFPLADYRFGRAVPGAVAPDEMSAATAGPGV